MTLPRVVALNRRWKQTPPAAVSLAAIARWAGAIERAPREQTQAANDESLGELAAMMNTGDIPGMGVAAARPDWMVAGMTLTDAERAKIAERIGYCNG